MNELFAAATGLRYRKRAEGSGIAGRALMELPVDDEAKVRIAAMLMGLGVSKETILKFLPSSIIPDALKELEKSGDSFPDNIPPDTGSRIDNEKAMQ